MRKRNIAVFFVLLLCSLTAASCKHYVAHPGSVDKFDSETYDTLTVAQAVLDQAKQEYANGTISGDTAKTAINKTGAIYNELRDAWLAYRGLKSAGQDATARVQAIQALVPQINQAITDLQALLH